MTLSRHPYLLPGLLLILNAIWSLPLQAADQLLILQYHHVSVSTPPSTSLSPELFARHMEFLHEAGYSVLPLQEGLQRIQRGESLPERAVSITFDDAYQSVYTAALPILHSHGYPFTVFISAGLIGDSPGLYSNWEQLRDMASQGATLANHSMSHAYLLNREANESEADWLARTRKEIIDAETIIEAKTGQSHRLLAYPYGEYNARIRAMVADLGYTGLGQQSGAVNASSDFTALPRFPFSGIYASMETFAERVSSLALAVSAIEPDDRTTDSGNPPATLVLAEGPWQPEPERLTCFHLNQPMHLSIEGQAIHMKSEAVSSSRRFRYNCTAPAGDGRYYWHAIEWVNPEIEE